MTRSRLLGGAACLSLAIVIASFGVATARVSPAESLALQDIAVNHGKLQKLIDDLKGSENILADTLARIKAAGNSPNPADVRNAPVLKGLVATALANLTSAQATACPAMLKDATIIHDAEQADAAAREATMTPTDQQHDKSLVAADDAARQALVTTDCTPGK